MANIVLLLRLGYAASVVVLAGWSAVACSKVESKGKCISFKIGVIFNNDSNNNDNYTRNWIAHRILYRTQCSGDHKIRRNDNARPILLMKRIY